MGVYRELIGNNAEQMLLADVEIGDEEYDKAIPLSFDGRIAYAHVFKITTSDGIESEDRIYPPAQEK